MGIDLDASLRFFFWCDGKIGGRRGMEDGVFQIGCRFRNGCFVA